MADVATGATITFGTTGFSLQIRSFSIDGIEIPKLDVTHLGTTGYRSFIFGDLKNPGDITMQCWFDPTWDPTLGTSETITITWPDSTTWAFTGAITKYSVNAEEEAVMTADVTVSIAGAITVT